MAEQKKCPFKRFQKEKPEKFDKRSFRTIKMGMNGAMRVIGCPKGKWDNNKVWRDKKGKRIVGKCKVGTRTQTVLIPKCPKRRKKKARKGGRRR